MDLYEKSYKDVLERAKKELRACGSQDCDAARQIFRLFPELKESEGERIKKEIIRILKGETGYTSKEDTDKYIAWLEKQGEQTNPHSGTSFEYNGHIWGMCARDNGVDILLDKQLFKHLEKQDEQKPNDKVKPKFKVGDWIILPLGIIAHIDSINSTDYQVTTTDGKICDFKISKQDNYRLWTIADATDGDVLLEEETGEPFIYNGNRATDFLSYFLGAHCGICNGVFNPLGNNHHWGKNSCPATKEQRDLLFRKMKDAGYAWNANKKELKKIKVKALDPDKVIEWLGCDAFQSWKDFGL